MIDKGLPIGDEVNALAQEVDDYTAMLMSRGFKNLEKEIEFHVADLYDQLVSCDLDKVRAIQGQIEALRWLRGLPEEAAEQLEKLQVQLRAETTE